MGPDAIDRFGENDTFYFPDGVGIVRMSLEAMEVDIDEFACAEVEAKSLADAWHIGASSPIELIGVPNFDWCRGLQLHLL